MPVWDFHTSHGLSASQRQALADSITKLYTNVGLPAFYVHVGFREATLGSMYVGGVDRSSAANPYFKSSNSSSTSYTSSNSNPSSNSSNPTKYAMITINHIARQLPDEESRKKFLGAADKILAPVFEGGDWVWEYFLIESSRDLWKVNGMVPPETDSELERIWREEGFPVKEGEDGRSRL